MLRSGLLVLILAAPMLAQNAVWVVGPASGPGIDFTDVQSAVSAAAQGDTILVNSGVYAPFVVTDKSVSLTASSGAAVTIQGFAIVQNLASTRFVTLTGITFQADGPSMPALHCDHNAGAVWLQDCDLAGYSQAPIVGVETGTAALVVDICASVVLSHCSLTGGAGAGGRPALLSSYSQVHLYASTCVGGTGGCDTSEPMHCFLPAAAVSVNGGLLSVQSSMLQGGASAPGELQCVPVFGCLCVQVLQGAPAITLVSGFPPMQFARGAGLTALSMLAPLRRAAMRRGMAAA